MLSLAIPLTILASLLIALLPSLELLFYSILYFKGLTVINRNPRRHDNGITSFTHKNSKDNVLLSIIIPVKNEPLELFDRALRSIANCGLPKEQIEVIIVSDDIPLKAKELKQYVSDLSKKLGINVLFYHRDTPRGGRSGALNDGVRIAKGKYVMTYDVDNVLEKHSITKAIEILEEDNDVVAVVLRWKPLNMDTRISEMQAYALDYLMDSLYRGFSGLNLSVFPLGSGTIYRKDVLINKLRGWDEKRIQDDMEIGVRIFCSGYRTAFVDNVGIKVELPPTIKALRIQQCRWSYGAMDALISRLNYLLSSKNLPLLGKVLSIIFLLQYTPVVAVTLGLIIMSILVYFNMLVEEILFISSIISTIFAAIYVYSFIHAHKHRGRGVWSSIVMLGRSSAIVTYLAPWITWYTFKALLRLPYKYVITPKGRKAYDTSHSIISFGQLVGIVVIIVLLALAYITVIHGYYFATVPYALFIVAILYVFYRWWKEL